VNEADIKAMVSDWYNKLDVHAPMVELLPMLVDSGLEMVFPEATLRGGHAAFEGWYQGVIRIFFDEVHVVKKAEVTPRDDGSADVEVVVHWEASVWKPPARNSERISLDAFQRWVVVPGPDGRPQIRTYIVDSMEFDEGSAKL